MFDPLNASWYANAVEMVRQDETEQGQNLGRQVCQEAWAIIDESIESLALSKASSTF